MRNTIAIATLILVLLGLFAYIFFNEENYSEPLAIPAEENIGSTTDEQVESEDQSATVNTVVIGDGPTDFGVYTLLSTGERIKIAESDNPDTIEDYFNIVTYHEAFVSPDKKFVALQASLFEDSFIQVYVAGSDTLHERQWGRIVEWTDDNLLKVDSCDLSGEDCTYLISSGSETPWEFVPRDME